jgi:hypothetical protein
MLRTTVYHYVLSRQLFCCFGVSTTTTIYLSRGYEYGPSGVNSQLDLAKDKTAGTSYRMVLELV